MVWRLRTSCVNLEMVLGSQLYHGLMSWLGHRVSLWETPHLSTWGNLLHLILLGLHLPLPNSFLQLKICKMDLTIVFILLSLSTSHVNWFKDMLPKHRCERMGTSGEGIKTVQEQWLKNSNNTFFSFSCSCFITSPWIPRQTLSNRFWASHTFRDFLIIIWQPQKKVSFYAWNTSSCPFGVHLFTLVGCPFWNPNTK